MDETPFGDDSLHEECGVFGIFQRTDAAAVVTLGLHALQHRGQEAAGIVSYDGSQFHVERHSGLIGDTFTKQSVLERLPGTSAIGHTRYATSGGGGLRNVQPFFAELSAGGFAVAHNGNITNAMTVQRELQRRGSIFSSTSDTETILHLVATSAGRLFVDKLIDALSRLEGAFSLVGLSSKKMVGVRDPLGIRPLVLGEFEGSLILASETCALDIMGATFVRDIAPGELVIITEDGIESVFPFQARRPRFCIFEYVYFARPDSNVEGRNVYDIRKKIGAELARESHAEADIVVPVPDSGVPAAIGYAQEANLPFELGIIRNHYVGRTFIQPTDAIRHMGVKLKHNANRKILEGKRVVLVDDSIVRGTTSQKIVQMVREAGAAEVHMRIASPPTRASCFYGVDTPEKGKLLASRMTIEEMADYIKVDSLAFLTIDGLYRAVDEPERNRMMPQFCDACFTGDYPTSLTDQDGTDNVRQLSLLGGAG
ncbi:MAG: amidophosphoribosyltransferase [Aurantimonas endophytica]|uniref:Amidophosphoribosyltransferase n=1 Tax=Aurantimonas endophytica TaxID=1522175 RepID=A0A7W6MMN7_9HYPH|nr:amidophosphoribosyltransferase [Aurantimonas endophytica]MBB4001008.1 amidophosphoribosyltransferase [Aurantimonas endophytica]MCO6403336.1 amidophosphoribosyltransferase [Aurantimonas endophytica]